MDKRAVDAIAFNETLLAQRQARIKGGIYHLTQIEMAYNSNRIEGSRLSEDQTRSLYETQTIEGAVPADNIIETSNHFRAFDWILDHAWEPFTAATIKHLHRLLKTGTSESLNPSFRVGDWKVLRNGVGGQSRHFVIRNKST